MPPVNTSATRILGVTHRRDTWYGTPSGRGKRRAGDRDGWSAGQFSRWGPPTGIARERETCTDDAALCQSHGWSAGQFSRWGPLTGIARERETCTDDAAPCQSHGWSAGQFSRWGPPTGIARERETCTDDAALCQSHGWSAGLRPASRGSAKRAPTTLRYTNLTAGAPVSDRHRAGARNQHRRRCAMPISRLERRSPTGIARDVSGKRKFPVCVSRKRHTMAVVENGRALHDVDDVNSEGAGRRCTDGRRGCC